MAPITPQLREDINTRLDKVIETLEAHPLWQNPPNPNPNLYFVWDFANRSKYMLSEYDNIVNGRPVLHPNQFRPAPGTGEAAAKKVFQEACGRTMMLKMIVTDTSGRTAMMFGNSGPPFDYGDAVKQAVEELDNAVPQEHMMAGMLG